MTERDSETAQREPLPEDIAAMSFDTAMRELEEIVRRLESGSVGLEESIEIYARGSQLKRHCEDKLRDAESRVERIVLGESGEASGREPADLG